jgi:hypothetical protein
MTSFQQADEIQGRFQRVESMSIDIEQSAKLHVLEAASRAPCGDDALKPGSAR